MVFNTAFYTVFYTEFNTGFYTIFYIKGEGYMTELWSSKTNEKWQGMKVLRCKKCGKPSIVEDFVIAKSCDCGGIMLNYHFNERYEWWDWFDKWWTGWTEKFKKGVMNCSK